VSYFVAALLGILQGLTEFLPVSSTAHLLLGGRMLGQEDPAFTVMIQFGSILAVVWVYRLKILDIVIGLPSKPEARRFTVMLVAACLPAMVAGLLLKDFIGRVLYAESPGIIAAAFILGGIVMLAVERMQAAPKVLHADQTPIARAVGIGCCQTLALVPGVSRSGATIIGGRLLGLERGAAAEFSFFLAMPTMAGAFVLELADVWGSLAVDRGVEIAIGFTMAFVAALLVVKPFLRFVSASGFAPFAWYRIVAGLGICAAIAAGWL